MTNEKIILQLEKGYDIKNPQLAQVLTNIENNGVTKEEFTEAMETKADLVGGKVPAEQLPSYVDDVIEFESIINGSNPINFYLNNQSYTDKVYYIQGSTSIEGTLNFKYNKKFINFGTNTSEDDWIIVEPEEGKIYIKIGSGNDLNHSFRWSGSDLIDLDKNWSDRIEYLGLKTYTLDLGTITDPLDLSESTNTSQFADLYTYLNQRYKFQLLNLLWYYNGTAYNFPIIDVDPVERSFRIYNQGYLQTYKVLKEGSNYSLEKISDISGYVYFDYNDASINKIAANSLKTNKAVPALLVMDGYVFTGYCTKVNEGTTTFIVFNKQAMETYYMNNLTGRFTFINTLDTDTIVNYDSIRGSKTNAEAKQELINILAGDTVVIDASKLGTTLTNEEAATVQKATTLIVTNIPDIGTIVFNRGNVTNTEIHFTAVSMAFMGSTYAKAILYSKNTKVLTTIQAHTANPFQWYLNNGGIIAVQADFTALNNFLYDHTFIIDKTLLNTTISDTAIQNGIKRANILVVKDSTDNSYVLYIKGAAKTDSHFFYNINTMISTTIDIKRIEFKISTNLLSAGTVYFSSAFKSYQLGGGTKYTTESAFNTAFAAAIDAYTSTI